MLTNYIKELEAAKAKVAELESTIVNERRQALQDLPAQLGYASVAELIKALKGVDAAPKARRQPAKAAPSGEAKSRRTRTAITDEIRATVKQLIGEGKSGAEIAKAAGISLPSVQNIKKQLGLVKARG